MNINKNTLELYLKYIRQGGHFEINLCRYGSKITNKIAKSIVSGLIKPIWNARVESRLFDIQRKNRRPNDTLSIKKRRSYETDPEHDEPLWERILQGKEPDKNWVLCVCEEEIPIAEIAENSWDPQYVADLTSVASKVSLDYCREQVQNKNRCCFLIYRSALGISMSVHARTKILESFYTACAQKCHFTGRGLAKEFGG
jgi:hypothetical protein